MLDHADIIRFALFGHTHMDEFRLLRRASSGAAIPAKVVPSVTPFFGNHPAFLVATVDPRTATLKDWRTFVSPGPDGSTPPWTEAYRFSASYHLPDFSAASAIKLAEAFTADPTGQAAESSTFRQHFYAGDLGIYALGLNQIWPAYACAIREDRPSAVHSCICSTPARRQKRPVCAVDVPIRNTFRPSRAPPATAVTWQVPQGSGTLIPGTHFAAWIGS